MMDKMPPICYNKYNHSRLVGLFLFKKLFGRVNSRVFLQYFLCFMLLLALAVAFNGVVALRSYDVLRQECRISNSTQAARFAQVFDEMLQSSDASLLKLEQNYDFIYTVSLERQNKAQDHYRLYCVRTLLNLTLRANQADLFVYYGGSDVIVSAANSTARSDLYYDVYYAGTRQDYWNWKAFINGSETSKVGTVYYGGKPCLAIARTLPTNITGTSKIVAVSVFRNEIIDAFMDNASGEVAVYSLENKPLITSDAALTADLNLPDDAPAREYLTLKSGGGTWYVYIIDSVAAACRYVSITPDYVFTAPLDVLRRFQIGVNLLLVALGVLLAWVLARRNAKPLEEAVKSISEKTNVQYDRRSKSELEYLRATIEHTLDEKKLFQNTFDMRSDVLQQNFLYEAVTGTVRDADSLQSLFARNRLPLISDRFAILLLRGWHEEPIPPEVVAPLVNHVRDMKALCYPLYLISPSCACIVNLPAEFTVEELDALCARFRAEQSYTFCRSDIYSGLDGLHAAFKEAAHLVGFDIVYGDTVVITPENVPHDCSFSFNAAFAPMAETELSRAIQDESVDCCALFDRLRAAYSSDGATNPRSVRCFMYDMRRFLTAAITRQCSAAFASQLDIDGAFFSAEALPWFRDQAVSLLEQARAHYADNHSDNALCAQALAYLDEHYGDRNLGVGTLDKMFGVSSAYLSERFRAHTGQGIGDYLTSVRMMHACRLLRETDMTLEEIAESVGIVGSSTLIRLFKKTQGVTPGVYRRTHGALISMPGDDEQ